MFCRSPVHRCLQLWDIGDVAGDIKRLYPVLVRHFFGKAGRIFAANKCDKGTLLQKALGQGRADSIAAAGDEHRLALDIGECGAQHAAACAHWQRPTLRGRYLGNSENRMADSSVGPVLLYRTHGRSGNEVLSHQEEHGHRGQSRHNRPRRDQIPSRDLLAVQRGQTGGHRQWRRRFWTRSQPLGSRCGFPNCRAARPIPRPHYAGWCRPCPIMASRPVTRTDRPGPRCAACPIFPTPMDGQIAHPTFCRNKARPHVRPAQRTATAPQGCR